MSNLAQRPANDYTAEQVDLIKQTVAAGTTDLELQLFLEVAKSSGLNPFQRQIYAVMRWDARTKKEKMVIQTGIDGYRLIATRTGAHLGTTDPEFGPIKDGYPEWARVTVRRLVQGHTAEFTATARWSEYVQKTKDGVSNMWAKMPHTMLGKCSEALALRKAFPAELSGVYTSEEMQQADTAQVVEVQQVKTDPAAEAWAEKARQMQERVVKAFPQAASDIHELLESLPNWELTLESARGMYEGVRDIGLEYKKEQDAPVDVTSDVVAPDSA